MFAKSYTANRQMRELISHSSASRRGKIEIIYLSLVPPTLAAEWRLIMIEIKEKEPIHIGNEFLKIHPKRCCGSTQIKAESAVMMGAPGPAGAPGIAGKNGVASFAYIYSVKAQDINKNKAVVFDSADTAEPIAYKAETSAISLTDTGSYFISFKIMADGLWAVAVNGKKAYTYIGNGNQVSGDAIINVTKIPAKITIKNISGKKVSVSNETENTGYTGAYIIIFKLN